MSSMAEEDLCSSVYFSINFKVKGWGSPWLPPIGGTLIIVYNYNVLTGTRVELKSISLSSIALVTRTGFPEVFTFGTDYNEFMWITSITKQCHFYMVWYGIRIIVGV